MKPLAVMDTDRRTERAALRGPNHDRLGSRGGRSLQTIAVELPKRLRKMTQKTQGTTRTPSRRGFLNRIFTITPTTSPGAYSPRVVAAGTPTTFIRRTAGEEGEVVDLSVNIRPGLAVTSPLPERTAPAGHFIE